MSDLIAAIRFLTSIPIKWKDSSPEALSRSTAYYPIVGLILGTILAGLNIIITPLIGPMAASAIIVVALTALTGGIHLDGLSDTADAFFSGRDRASVLEIMRDPRSGAMGTMAIASDILLKFALLASVKPHLMPVSLVLMCVLSRWSMTLTIFLFPYARKEGKAKILVDGITSKIFIFSCAIAAAISTLAFGLDGIFLMAITAGLAYLIGNHSKRKIGGITGDVLGASNELIELSVLFIFCALK